MKHLVVALAFALALTGCATDTGYQPKDAPAAVAAPEVKVGDFWEYAVRDYYTGFERGLHRLEVTQVEPGRVVVRVSRDGEPLETRVYASGWNGVDYPLTNLGRWRFEPPFPAYDFPLAPGKTWYTVVKAIDPATRQTHSVHTRARVVGWERIKVPAGEFDALRIQRQIFAGNQTAWRTQETIDETEWYVPSIRRYARAQGSSEHFDTSYGGGDEGGEYPQRIRGDWLVSELVRYSR